jgi:hypothetical protein
LLAAKLEKQTAEVAKSKEREQKVAEEKKNLQQTVLDLETVSALCVFVKYNVLTAVLTLFTLYVLIS